LPISIEAGSGKPLLAVGAHLKSTIAISRGENIFVSQHLGDLETQESLELFRNTISDFKDLYRLEPAAIVHDLHPDYLSTKEAKSESGRTIEIQHHYAHIKSCMAENQIQGPVLGVAWDGTGFGTDGTVWGGEFLLPHGSGFDRIGSLRPFLLPGAEAAIKEPRRSAIGVLFEIFGESLFDRSDIKILEAYSDKELAILRQMLTKKINSPITTSAGRLFDAVAALVGIAEVSRFEGQAAMELEFCTDGSTMEDSYTCPLAQSEDRILVDWAPMIVEILDDRNNHDVPDIAAKFHNTLVESIVAVARSCGENRVVLSGGCFQNSYLTERTIRRLREEGFQPYWHQRVPPNDGGISLGQLAAAQEIMKIKDEA
jgi:hydrogenase maturation protein HypF